MGNSFAYLVLFGSPLFVLFLFRVLPRTEALCWTIIGGYLFLPYGIGIDFPVLPTLSKDLIPALSAALVLLAMGKPLTPRPRPKPGPAQPLDLREPAPSPSPASARQVTSGVRPSFARPRGRSSHLAAPNLGPNPGPNLAPLSAEPMPMQVGRLPLVIPLLMILLVACQFGTVLTNAMPQQFGPLFLPGLRLYDGFSMAQGAILTLLPFWLGLRHLASEDHHRVLLRVLVVGALLYALPALAESIKGPQLAGIIYGYYGVSWIQAIRGFGFRPVLFLQHGLWLGIFMAMAAMAAFVLMRAIKPRLASATWTAIWLLIVLFLCNSFGAIMVCLVFLPFLFLSLRVQLIFAAAMAAIMMTYPVLRGADIVPVEMVRDLSQSFSEERASSLQFRLDNEDRLLDRIREQSLFGWGGYGRNRVYDPESGRDISETDGAWIIVMGVNGWAGYLATYGLLGMPILLLALRRRRIGVSLVTGGLCLILSANLVDMISNATLTPVTWLIAGALAGRLRLRLPDNMSPEDRGPEDRPPGDRGAAKPAAAKPPGSRRGLALRSGRAGPQLRRAGGLLLGLCCAALPLDLRASDLQGSPGGMGLGASGLAAPLLAFNLDGLSDWSPALPFLDLMKTSRPFLAHGPKGWGAMSHQDLQAGGYLDAQGWPLAIPPGMHAVGTVWDWGSSARDPALAAWRAGVYVLRHQGRGRLELSGDVEILAETQDETRGEIVFRNKTGGTLVLNITATDPEGTGDHIRNITLVRQDHLALHEMGLLFHPDWLALIQDARQIRFMAWMQTNGTTSADWESRARVTDATHMLKGAPVEVMVQLANQIGAEPWFTMPAGASEDYIRNFATYVRDHLDPGLKVHVEYSNETWNWGFAQTKWLADQARTVWGRDDDMGWLDYKAMLATRTALIWDEVFGAEAEARVDNVLGIQTGATWLSGRTLEAPLWQEMDPAGHVTPDKVFDSLALTTYFGGATLTNPELRAELLDKIRADPATAAPWLTARLLDPAYPGSIPQIIAYWEADKALARRYGLDLLAYEGGQHLLQGWMVTGMTEAEQALVTDFLTGYVQGPEMAHLYQVLWEAWAKLGDGPFMQFSDVGLPSKWGAWGLYRHLGDATPRARLLERLNATAAPWFGAGEDGVHKQGIIWQGRAGPDILGTDRDDFLVGSRGDDRFTPGKGRDAVSGEGGRDILILQGRPEDHILTREGKMLRIETRSAKEQAVTRFRGIALLGFVDPGGESQLLPLEAFPLAEPGQAPD